MSSRVIMVHSGVMLVYSGDMVMSSGVMIGDKRHNWVFQIGDLGLGNRLELVGIDRNRLERLE